MAPKLFVDFGKGNCQTFLGAGGEEITASSCRKFLHRAVGLL